MILKTIALTGPTPNTTSYCKFEGCEGKTREGKPRCYKHIEDMDYAKEIHKELQRREGEIQLLLKEDTDQLDKDSHLVKEVMSLLVTTNYTAPALAKLLRISVVSSERLVTRIAELNLAVCSKTKRNKLRISPHGVELPKKPRRRRRRPNILDEQKTTSWKEQTISPAIITSIRSSMGKEQAREPGRSSSKPSRTVPVSAL